MILPKVFILHMLLYLRFLHFLKDKDAVNCVSFHLDFSKMRKAQFSNLEAWYYQYGYNFEAHRLYQDTTAMHTEAK